ncbi:MAG: NAD+ synthase, partial [Dinoroseobacter sp.]|nr:NAD+ synthase [Dinoroseobacter sp.]
MTDTFRLTLAQLNPTVGAFDANAAKAKDAWEHAKTAEADMIALPEMFLTGYQTQDMAMKPAFTRSAMSQVEDLAQSCADGPAMGIGTPWLDETGLYNGYAILEGG